VFDVTGQAPGQVRFRLRSSPETLAVYPFAFALDLHFRLEGWRLDIVAHVGNPGETPLPFSFGYHPAFAWPLPGGADKAAHRLTFAQPEPEAVRRVAPGTGLLLPDAEPSPVQGCALALDEALFRADAVIWTDLASRALAYGAPGGASLDLAFPDTPMLGLWQVPGARYICIEPWQGHADPAGFDGEFITKPGLAILPPGAVRSFLLSITVNP
jgi:galactose mutarotase-like enzyme